MNTIGGFGNIRSINNGRAGNGYYYPTPTTAPIQTPVPAQWSGVNTNIEMI